MTSDTKEHGEAVTKIPRYHVTQTWSCGCGATSETDPRTFVDHTRLGHRAPPAERAKSDAANAWQPIETAPDDGTHIEGLCGILARRTWWGKTSHVPLYGWVFMEDPDDVETCDLWRPTHWQPLLETPRKDLPDER